MADLLAVSALSSGYGKLPVLHEVSFSLSAGEALVILGSNGAGKTTLLKTLVGLLPASAGSIAFAGDVLTQMPTARRVRSGIAYMSELGVFPELTIAENLRLGAAGLPRSEVRAVFHELYGRFPDLARRGNAAASSLSGGQRKMLGIAKALAAKPRVLAMDEPSAGLSPLLVRQFIQTLAAFRSADTALLIAEQNVRFLELADRVMILDDGRVRFTGTVADARASDEICKAYFGIT